MTSKILSAAIGAGTLTGNSTDVVVSSNGAIELAGNNSTDIFIAANNNVGIGNTTPADALSVAGGIRATNGVYSNSTYGGTYTDGIVLDYTTGNGRISVGPSDGITFYNGNVAYNALATLDANGNFGVGVTPSAWDSGGKINLGPSQGLATKGDALYLGSNYYYNAGFKYATTGYASYYLQTSGQHQWVTAPSGTAGTSASFTQVMTLDANGNFGVGTSSPSSINGGLSKLVIYNGNISITSGSGLNNGFNIFTNGQASNNLTFAQGWATSNDNIGYIYNRANADFVFGTNNTERMRISANGNIGIGNTTPATSLQITGSGSTFTDPSNSSTPSIYVLNQNNSNTSAHSFITLRVGGSSAGNPFITWDIFNVSGFSAGIDNADSRKFKIQPSWNGGSFSTTTGMQIDTSGRFFIPAQPAFFAYKNIGDNYASAAGIQPMPNVKTLGNHVTSSYNSSTYTFTAPVAGLYHFDFVIAMTIGTAPGDISIAVNGTSYTNDGYTIIDIGTINWRSLGISAVIYLNASDAVTAYRTYAPNNPANTSWRGYFSGYLIG
jgi:hypothetical protein